MKTRGLRTQMVVSFMVIIILTAVAAWVPESWLIRNEFERQTWAQVEQGRRAARTLYHAWQSEVTNAAILTAQLPTLQTLLTAGNSDELSAYLTTVETSLDLDLVLACNMANQVAAQVGSIAMSDPCVLTAPVGFYIVPEEEGSPAWLLANQPVLIQNEPAGNVIAGIHLNEAFVTRMRGETRLHHTLLVDGIPVATSFTAGLPARLQAAEGEVRQSDEAIAQVTFTTPDNQSFYAARLPLDNPRIADEVALSATEILQTQRSLVRTGIVSIMVAILLGSGVSLVVARHLSRPLSKLDQAAAHISSGDLNQSVNVQSNIREVARVAATLERTRLELQQTLATLQQEKAWVEHLLEAIVEGIMILDENGRITYFSEGAARITGWQEDQVKNRLADDIFLPVNSSELFSQLIPASGRRRTIWVQLFNKQPAALSLTRAQLVPPDAATAQIAIVFRDVSEEEAVQRLLNNFLTNITHEFRTPLTALAASAELLLDDTETLTQAELKQMLSWLHLGILSLQTLVDNLLETASLEAGRFQISPHPTDLGEIIAEATRLMHPLLKKYQQHLTVEMPAVSMPVVHADSRRIVQVLVNLLSNANKYGPSDSEISIRTELQEDMIKIEVADRGPGVPEDNNANLFHRFLHVDVATDRKRSGVGLGLWVVKAIVEEHGGQVGVMNRSGGGSVFWFTLPLVEE
ncbi:MAG: HAMP domain-containing protein [Anaerolineaceae bacterium]|nr:HAMP domain-containing protein [Anaerolineaceae bacterium]